MCLAHGDSMLAHMAHIARDLANSPTLCEGVNDYNLTLSRDLRDV